MYEKEMSIFKDKKISCKGFRIENLIHMKNFHSSVLDYFVSNCTPFGNLYFYIHVCYLSRKIELLENNYINIPIMYALYFTKIRTNTYV